jgi:hypothetical protein
MGLAQNSTIAMMTMNLHPFIAMSGPDRLLPDVQHQHVLLLILLLLLLLSLRHSDCDCISANTINHITYTIDIFSSFWFSICTMVWRTAPPSLGYVYTRWPTTVRSSME